MVGGPVEAASGTLRAAVGLLALQGVAVLAAGVFLVVRGFGGDVSDRTGAELGGILAIVGAAALLALARGHLARRPWARSPTIVIEIICVPVGIGLLQGDRPAYGIPLLLIAVGVLVLLAAAGAFAPPQPE